KHGALSHPDGNVTIDWQIENDHDEPRLTFEWKERGGPPAEPPSRQGFGYTLLRTVLSDAELKPEIRFEAEGLYYRATVRVSAVLADSSRFLASRQPEQAPYPQASSSDSPKAAQSAQLRG